MKILKVGKWDHEGMPIGFIFQTEAGDGGIDFRTDKTGEVRVGGVEIVEWTEARKAAMGKNGSMPKKRKVKQALGTVTPLFLAMLQRKGQRNNNPTKPNKENTSYAKTNLHIRI